LNVAAIVILLEE